VGYWQDCLWRNVALGTRFEGYEMIRKLAVVASVGLLLAGQAAMAAQPVQLGGVQGSVLVNQNGRFVPVSSSTALRAGDRVMAMDGSAVVSYAGGCNVAISARSMTTIEAGAPCAGGSSNIVRAAYTTADEEQQGYGAPDTPPGTGWDFYLWAGFGLVTVTTLALTVSDSNDPSSP
jgi:hypothetical protein